MKLPNDDVSEGKGVGDDTAHKDTSTRAKIPPKKNIHKHTGGPVKAGSCVGICILFSGKSVYTVCTLLTGCGVSDVEKIVTVSVHTRATSAYVREIHFIHTHTHTCMYIYIYYIILCTLRHCHCIYIMCIYRDVHGASCIRRGVASCVCRIHM